MAHNCSDKGIKHLSDILFCITLSLLFGILLIPQSTAQGTSSNLDVILVIDNSGSMKSSDSDGLRWSAAQLFVDLATAGDRIGAIRFSDEVELLGKAKNGDLTPMGSETSREELIQALSSYNPDGETNMNAALRSAENLLANNDIGNKKVIVFLTDGKPYPESQRPELNKAIQDARNQDIMVFPILLGDDADIGVAEQMVHETGSLRQQATNAKQLLEAFGSVYTHALPGRYIDILDLKSNTTFTFQTNEEQAITAVRIVVPREGVEKDALKGLSLGEEDVLSTNILPSGASVSTGAARHYEMVKVKHNKPLTGSWKLNLGEVERVGLLIVQSEVILDLLYPITSKPGSFVAPRIVPITEKVLLIGRVERAGSRVSGEDVLVTFQGDSLHLSSIGLSPNQSLYWGFMDIGTQEEGSLLPIEFQVGQELTPFRLQKQFVLEPTRVPTIVVDSPSQTDNGIRAKGKLHIETHFEGGEITNPAVTAYVWDISKTDDSWKINLSCTEQRCLDESLVLQSGRSYKLLLVGQGLFNGRPYTDGILSYTSTGDVIRIDGVGAVRNLGILTPDSDLLSIPLDITAFTKTEKPEIHVHLENLTPPSSQVNISADLSPLEPSGSNTFFTELTFRHLRNLPPGQYTVDVVFTSDDAAVTPTTLTTSFEIPNSLLELVNMSSAINQVGCPGRQTGKPKNLIDFGVVLNETSWVSLQMEATWLEEIPNINLESVSIHEVGRSTTAVDLVKLQVGALDKTSKQEYFLPLTLELGDTLPPGHYTGEFNLISPQTSIKPITYAFVFHKPGLLGRLYYRLKPVRCLLINWYALAPPFPRLKGIISWVGTLFAVLLIIATIKQAQGIEGLGIIISEYDMKTAPLSIQNSLRVINETGDIDGVPCLDSKGNITGHVIAELYLEEDIETGSLKSAVLLPGDIRKDVHVYYYKQGRLRKVPPRGAHLLSLGRFQVRQGDNRYNYSIEF